MLKRLRLKNDEKGINVFKYFLNVLFALLEEIFPVLVPQLNDTVSFFGTPLPCYALPSKPPNFQLPVSVGKVSFD